MKERRSGFLIDARAFTIKRNVKSGIGQRRNLN